MHVQYIWYIHLFCAPPQGHTLPFTDDDTTHPKFRVDRFLHQAITYGLGAACQHPREALSLQLTPPCLTVAWKNNSTWKTIKTILTTFLMLDSQLLASLT